MSTLKIARPLESPENPDPLSRLVEVLGREGFVSTQSEEEAKVSGEQIYRRPEKVLFAEGETVFLLIDFPELSDKVLAQAVSGIRELFRAKDGKQKALSVFMLNTIFVCIIARSESPHYATLNRHITIEGGAVIIPVIIVPDINQVVYPTVEEKIGTVRPRIEYLRYLLGERKLKSNMHKQTVQTFYVSAAVVVVLVAGIIVSMVT